MNLKDYIKVKTISQLSHLVSYSDLFEKQYEEFDKRIMGVYNEDRNIHYYCWKEEEETFRRLMNEKKLIYNGEEVSNTNMEYLEEYSKYFEIGFDSLDYSTPANVVLNNTPFCSRDLECIKTERPKTKIRKIGRKISGGIPCIAGERQSVNNIFMGHGILNASKIITIPEKRILKNPITNAYNEGVMFRSIFLVIERYTEFSSYFSAKAESNGHLFEMELEKIIEMGESKEIEFKSSLRYCLRQKSAQKYVELEVFKNIAGFLNTNGGVILVGVEDDRNIIGLEETDYLTFKDDDKKDAFLKHFDNLVGKFIGDSFNSIIDIQIVEVSDKKVAKVCVKKKAPEPVFLKQKGKEDAFYIRRSASAIELKPQEMLKYVGEHRRG